MTFSDFKRKISVICKGYADMYPDTRASLVLAQYVDVGDTITLDMYMVDLRRLNRDADPVTKLATGLISYYATLVTNRTRSLPIPPRITPVLITSIKPIRYLAIDHMCLINEVFDFMYRRKTQWSDLYTKWCDVVSIIAFGGIRGAVTTQTIQTAVYDLTEAVAALHAAAVYPEPLIAAHNKANHTSQRRLAGIRVQLEQFLDDCKVIKGMMHYPAVELEQSVTHAEKYHLIHDNFGPTVLTNYIRILNNTPTDESVAAMVSFLRYVLAATDPLTLPWWRRRVCEVAITFITNEPNIDSPLTRVLQDILPVRIVEIATTHYFEYTLLEALKHQIFAVMLERLMNHGEDEIRLNVIKWLCADNDAGQSTYLLRCICNAMLEQSFYSDKQRLHIYALLDWLPTIASTAIESPVPGIMESIENHLYLVAPQDRHAALTKVRNNLDVMIRNIEQC